MIKVIKVEDEFTISVDNRLNLNLEAEMEVRARVPGTDDEFVTAKAIMEKAELRTLRDHLNKLLGEEPLSKHMGRTNTNTYGWANTDGRL